VLLALFVIPPVAALSSNSRVAGFTKSHEVTLFIASAFRERNYMMYFFCSGKLALLLTLFAERAGLNVTIPNTLPSSAISFVGSGVALKLVVVFVHCFLVLGTVLLAFCKPTAAGVSTGTFWFVGHGFTSLFGHRKSHHRFLCDGSSYIFLLILP
jgi:hypothetical protein